MKKTLIILGIILNFSLMAGGYYLYYQKIAYDEHTPITLAIIKECQSKQIKRDECLKQVLHKQVDTAFDDESTKQLVEKHLMDYEIVILDIWGSLANKSLCKNDNKKTLSQDIWHKHLEDFIDMIVSPKYLYSTE